MAGAFLDVYLDSRLAEAKLSELAERLGDLSVPLSDIGEHLLLATDTRFKQQVAPDGSPWAPLSPVTLAKKQGDRILRDSGILQDTTRYQVSGGELAVGTDRSYGAVHQFGQPRGASGKTRRGTPIPWGDIPARPFLGLSNEDEEAVARIVSDYLIKAD